MKLIIIFLIIILFMLFVLFKSYNIGLRKNIIITIICTLVIVQIILEPNICINYSIKGAKLFFDAVFPSLFPFLVITSFIIAYDGIYIYAKLFGSLLCTPFRLPKNCSLVLVISGLCGYPLGAKYACELYEKKAIDYDTCERLLNIASNPSPLFVIGAIGVSMLKNVYLGYLLLFSCYISCGIMAFILPSTSYKKTNGILHTYNNENIGLVLKNSIEEALKTCLSICGFLVIFSVIIGIIKNNVNYHIVLKTISSLFIIPNNLLEGVSLGFIEITNGASIVSISNLSMYYKLGIIGFFLGFGGLSILSQVYSFIYKYNFKVKRYFNFKILQGIICSATSLLLYKISSFSISVFSSAIKNTTSSYIFLFILVFLIIPITLFKIKSLFHTP